MLETKRAEASFNMYFPAQHKFNLFIFKNINKLLNYTWDEEIMHVVQLSCIYNISDIVSRYICLCDAVPHIYIYVV